MITHCKNVLKYLYIHGRHERVPLRIVLPPPLTLHDVINGMWRFNGCWGGLWDYGDLIHKCSVNIVKRGKTTTNDCLTVNLSCRSVALRKFFCWQTGLSAKFFSESYSSAAKWSQISRCLLPTLHRRWHKYAYI